MYSLLGGVPRNESFPLANRKVWPQLGSSPIDALKPRIGGNVCQVNGPVEIDVAVQFAERLLGRRNHGCQAEQQCAAKNGPAP